MSRLEGQFPPPVRTKVFVLRDLQHIRLLKSIQNVLRFLGADNKSNHTLASISYQNCWTLLSQQGPDGVPAVGAA